MRKLKHMVRGFTLVELLIVLAVIAALLAIATPIALNAVAQAKATQVAATFRNIRAAAESYIFTERATGVDLGTLVSSKYLTGNIDTTKWNVTSNSTQTVVTVTISYSGDVDKNRLAVILPEASNLTWTFDVPIWWP